MEAPAQRSRWPQDAAFTAIAAVAALAPRLYVALAWAREPVWDGHYYDFGARRIAAGLGYSDDVMIGGVARWHPWCHYPVGYSGFLAGVYKLFGDGPHAATVANAVLGALMVALVHRVSLRVMSPWRARAAAALCAVHPGLIVYSGLVMTELLSGVLPLAALWLALRYGHRRPVRGAILSGAVVGLAALVSPPNILIAPALGLALSHLVASRKAVRDVIARGALVTAVAFAITVPWTLRNCRVMDGCAFVSTNGGWNLAIGAFERATGRFETLRASDGCKVVTGQVQQDRCWARLGLQAIRRDPKRWIGLAPVKLDHSFNHESFAIEYLRTADPLAWPEDRRVRWRQGLTTFHRVLLSVAAFGFLGAIGRKQVRERRWKAVGTEAALWLVTAALVWLAWSGDTHTFWPLALWIPVLGMLPRSGSPTPDAVGWFVAWSLLTFDVVHVVFFGEDRYHMPLAPLLCILAAAVWRRARTEPSAVLPSPACTASDPPQP